MTYTSHTGAQVLTLDVHIESAFSVTLCRSKNPSFPSTVSLSQRLWFWHCCSLPAKFAAVNKVQMLVLSAFFLRRQYNLGECHCHLQKLRVRRTIPAVLQADNNKNNHNTTTTATTSNNIFFHWIVLNTQNFFAGYTPRNILSTRQCDNLLTDWLPRHDNMSCHFKISITLTRTSTFWRKITWCHDKLLICMYIILLHQKLIWFQIADGWHLQSGRNERCLGEFQADECAGLLTGPKTYSNSHRSCEPISSVIV